MRIKKSSSRSKKKRVSNRFNPLYILIAILASLISFLVGSLYKENYIQSNTPTTPAEIAVSVPGKWEMGSATIFSSHETTRRLSKLSKKDKAKIRHKLRVVISIIKEGSCPDKRLGFQTIRFC